MSDNETARNDQPESELVPQTSGRAMEPSDDPRVIEIEDVGPIDYCRLYAKPGRITVLMGRNGAGKTETLHAVKCLQSGQGGLSHRDGTVSGFARGLGAFIRITRNNQNRRSGELVIESLESNFPVSDLVNPPFKSVDAKDAHRIKALLLLAGYEANIEDFYGLIGGRLPFDEVVEVAIRDIKDPVKMASGVKRCFETASRAKKTEADTLRSGIRSKRDANEGIDLKAPHNREKLDESLADSIRDQATIVADSEAAEKSFAAAAAATESLEKATANYNGPTVEKATELEQAAILLLANQGDIVSMLERKLFDAEAERSRLDTVLVATRMARTQAVSHDTTLASWRKTIGCSQKLIPAEELTDAARSVTVRREMCEIGLLVREAIVREKEAEIDDQLATGLEAAAESFRNASLAVETVLTKAVKTLGIGLTVNREMRLVTQTVRGETYFDELSEGERWPIGIDIVIKTFAAMNQPGLLVLDQDAWQDLDGPNRKILADKIAGTDLSVLTAQADYRLDAPEGIEPEVYGE